MTAKRMNPRRTMSLSHDVRLAGKVAAACGSVVLLLGASACGSNGNDKNAGTTGQTGQQGGPNDQQGGPENPMPGTNGKVAAVTGSTAQVQGMDGQVAVTWTGSTTFTREVTARLADVRVGDCVLVGSADQPSSSDGTPATEVTASNVRITPKTNGSCDLGMRGPGGQAAPGGTGEGPQLNGTPPTGAPQGGRRPQVRAMAGAVGEVTAVSGSGFTVAAAKPGSDDTTAVTVTVDGQTTYTATAKGSASDVKVGVCVAANGTTDDTGAVTARTVAVSQPRDGQCGGFAQFRSSDGASSQES
jgi:hypothetical protein